MRASRTTTIRTALTLALAVAAVAAMAFAPATACDKDAKTTAVQAVNADLPAGQARVAIPTKGMSCAACASTVKVAVKKLDGIVDVQVDPQAGQTTVTYVKDKVTVKKIVEAINKTGFEASEPHTTKS
ncbi:MAG TPA: heavy metal-associated domain-containing protein [Candidatus Saccharimonadales bacterium]|nr:heavy metal-associated domain-containing protein [Candidatus Saccharimonadales bacterium]